MSLCFMTYRSRFGLVLWLGALGVPRAGKTLRTLVQSFLIIYKWNHVKQALIGPSWHLVSQWARIFFLGAAHTGQRWVCLAERVFLGGEQGASE